MRTSGNFKDILSQLEEGEASQKNINKLLVYLKNDNVYNPVFENYITTRLRANIHPERLLQLAYNLEKNDQTSYLSSIINDRLINSITAKGENYDQFYFMCRHDTRTYNHIMKNMMESLGTKLDNSTIEVINTIAPVLKENKYDLLLKAIGSTVFSHFRTAIFMDRLSVEEQYLLAERGLQNNDEVVLRLLRGSNTAFREHVGKEIKANGDKDLFVSALRNSTLSIVKIEENDFIYLITELFGSDIPETLNALYDRAEKEGRYEYLLHVCEHKNKKDVLRTICNAKDKELIDRFFDVYKNNPQVKHLVPFL